MRVDADNAHTIQGVFWKVRTASEPASYTFTNTTGDTNKEGSGAITAYTGVDTVSPIDAHAATTYPSGGTSIVGPSVTTTVPGTQLLTLVGQRSNGDLTPAAGMAERYVRQALGRWEPRIAIESITAAPDPDHPAALLIDVRYRIKATHSSRSLVFPFYLIPEE